MRKLLCYLAITVVRSAWRFAGSPSPRSSALFTMFVIVAIVTTASAGPVLDHLKVGDDARKLAPHYA